MNSIRALNVRTRLAEIPGHHSNRGPDRGAPGSHNAPFDPATQPVAEKPATALSRKATGNPEAGSVAGVNDQTSARNPELKTTAKEPNQRDLL
jgi:hypothetical protein